MKSIGDIAQAAVARQLETPDGPPPPGRQRAVMRAEGRHQVFAQLRDLKSPFPFNEMVKALERAASPAPTRSRGR